MNIKAVKVIVDRVWKDVGFYLPSFQEIKILNDAGGNEALVAQLSSSQTYDTHVVARVNDNDSKTWCALNPGVEYPAQDSCFILMELPAVVSVASIVVVPNGVPGTGYSNPRNFRILVSQDGVNFTIYETYYDVPAGGDIGNPYNDNIPCLTAIAGDEKVTLNWTAVTGANGYNIKRSITAGGPYTTIANNVSATSYIDDSVVNGTTYYYIVTAITASGESANSNEVPITPRSKVGQQLTAPEDGWKRCDDADPKINYIGNWEVHADSNPYNGSYHSSPELGSSANFNFRGTKLRIIGFFWSQETTSMLLYIDGELKADFNQYEVAHPINQCLLCEIKGLSNEEHAVQLVNNAAGYGTLDAIDIDKDGELLPYSPVTPPVIPAPVNLIATAGDSKVTLSWTAVTGATGYNVKRSTTAGGTYTTIASNVTNNSYVDSSVVNGTTYYYVVTAITADGESTNSNEVSATPQEVVIPPTAGNVLLRVTMIDSSEREYRINQNEIDGFVNWYTRTIGTGISCYAINDIVDGSKEYLAFEKIISFKVIPVVK